MNCETLASELTSFLEGELSPDDESAAIEHLATCDSCETVLAETREVIALAQQHGRESLTDDDRSRLLSNLLNNLEP